MSTHPQPSARRHTADFKTLHLKVTEETVCAMEQHRQQLGLTYLWEVLEHYASASHRDPK